MFSAFKDSLELSNLCETPKIPNKSIKVLVSFKLGVLLITVSPAVNSAEAIIGKTAFFAPLISTAPFNLFPPIIANLSMDIRS